jgi:hypothetical protein
MGYKYYCKCRTFGCDVVRTRKTAIETHHKKCRLVKKFKSWLELKKENEFLKSEVARLTLLRGRPPVEIHNVDMRDFTKEFAASEELRGQWKTLSCKKRLGVYALVRLFMAKSPRFYKVLSDRRHVEVCGWFGSIRTFGEVHTYSLEEMADAIFSVLALEIESNLVKMGFSEEDYDKFNLDAAHNIPNPNSARLFMMNSMNLEVSRRRAKGPLTFREASINI